MTIRAALFLVAAACVWLPAEAQTPAAAPAFQSASIRLSANRDTQSAYAGFEDGSVLISNMTVMAMVAEAYGMDEGVAPFTVTGDDPLLFQRFTIDVRTMLGNTTVSSTASAGPC